MAFQSPARGYGLFSVTAGSRCLDEVGMTADGGTRFGPAAAVFSWPCADSPPAATLAFDGQGDGFLYGPALYMTHDGGRTWAASHQSGQVLAIAPSGRSVWLLEADCRGVAGPQQCPLRLLESADGGHTWRPSPSQPPGSVAAQDGQAGLESAAGQTWLVRTGPASGYVTGEPALSASGKPDAAPLWFTSDAGSAWSSRRVQCGFDAMSLAMSAAPDGTLFAACAGQPAAGSQGKSTAASADGGRTWTVRASCGLGDCPRSPLGSGYLGEIAAGSASTAYLAGGRSRLLVTHDGGRHWQAVAAVTAGTDGGTGPVFTFGASDVIVLGDDFNYNDLPSLWTTTDGGAHWSVRHPRIST